MNIFFDIEKLIKDHSIKNELDYERALIADRKLRLMAKENAHFKILRKKLRDFIEDYENNVWCNIEDVSDEQVSESEESELVAESERVFIEIRKDKIREKLKSLNLTQENFGLILGHKSKTYMSELMNGIKPFTIKDLMIINRLLKIKIEDLVPTFLSVSEQSRIRKVVTQLDNPHLKLSEGDLAFSITCSDVNEWSVL